MTQLNVGIGIATAGRSDQMKLTLAQLQRLDPAPSLVVVCPATEADFVDNIAEYDLPIRVVSGNRGSCPQRNAILRAATHLDVIVFMDDDFYPATDYLAHVEQLFRSHPEVVAATNHPELDGATGPGIPEAVAAAEIAHLLPVPFSHAVLTPTYGAYGCNMSIRMSTVLSQGLAFDETLPLYGWLEDIDFSRQLSRHGLTMKCSTLRGVHLGTKAGRTPGRRLGYSQVANPAYLWRKGSVSGVFAIKHAAKNMAMNLAKSVAPEPWVDRRGRLTGNLLALRDIARGIVDPLRAKHLAI